MGALTLLITGAAGFVGRHTVAVARARGHRVRALVRRAGSIPSDWQDDPEIAMNILDLSAASAEQLSGSLIGVDAVIHIAAAMGGDDAVQERDTVRPTETLIAAMNALGLDAPELILVSSLSVYDGRALAAGSVLDEDSPLEATPDARDAYCRAKLSQERLAREAAADGLTVSILRPGAVFGPRRLWNGHLGHPVGPLLLGLGGQGEVPVCHVAHCAQALVLAAEADGDVGTINVIDDDRPSRAEYLKALRKGGWPKFMVPLPWRVLSAIGGLLSALGLGGRLPGLLRPATLHARMKPFRFDNSRLKERLDWRPSADFGTAMDQALAEEKT